MKKTAVEWLMDKYRTQNGVITAADYHKAKEMEKKQIIDVVEHYCEYAEEGEAEQYYNETFKSE